MTSEDFVDSTIASLKIIGMVPKNGKLCIRKGQLCIDTSIKAQGLWRFFNGDSRDMTLMHAKNTINNAMKITRALMNSATKDEMNIWTIQRIYHEMDGAQGGLQNLKTTYTNDSMMIANLEVIIDRQRANGEEIRKYLSELPHGRPCDTALRGTQKLNLFPVCEAFEGIVDDK